MQEKQNSAAVANSLASEPPKAILALEKCVNAKINFAMAQNNASVLHSLCIHNSGDVAATDVSLTLRAKPAVLRDKVWQIDRIRPGEQVELGDLATPLDTAILGGIDEAEVGQLEFSLKIGDDMVLCDQAPVELLARDEWGGLHEMENILAAFVSPNQPQVARLLKQASSLLEAAGHDGSMEGYQSNSPQRVWMIAGAIWSAATGLNLAYAVPPASFERSGQKIRDPERIVAEGLATCLDTALLMAAAFEAAGLHASILFSRGHAWVGVWITKNDFGKLIEPDVIAVRKAAAAREFIALETTLLTKRPSVGFEQAMAAGRERLSEENETEFEKVIDINRARAARIRPLASHREPIAADQHPDASAPAALPRPLDLGHLPGDIIETAPSTALGRIERWQRKLLDLSLANKLLNFKETKLSVGLTCPNVSELEDQLAEGKTFRLLALKDENALSGRDVTPQQARAIETSLALDALAKGQVAVPLTAHEMANRLTGLYRKARSDIQEGGTNTLFLVVGFLRWKRTESEPRHYRAPLLLLPVKLERRSAQSEFRLTQLEDEVRINATLLELLKRDFELRIPELEGELPCDERGLDIPRILEIVRRRVRDVAGFEVLEECALSTFSFAKYLMWKDLVDRTDNLRESALVRHLVDSPSEAFEGAGRPMPRPEDIDHRHAPADILAPLPADSSQLAAVVAAAERRDFVLIGPPGTGKSQTITNIIADQLARGRTVLFVAEKAAALDVVQRRLVRQGLGSAVLELHSNKADRKTVLQQLGRSWQRASTPCDQEWMQITDDVRITRDQLNAYVEELHRPGTQGFSIFQAIGRAVSGPVPFALTFVDKDCHDTHSWNQLRALATELGQRHAIVADLPFDGPLSLISPGEWSYAWQDKLLETAQRLQIAIREVNSARAELGELFGCSTLPPEAWPVIDRLPTLRLGKPAIDSASLHNPHELRAAMSSLANELAQCDAARRQLKGEYEDRTIATMPLEALELQWREAGTKFVILRSFAQNKVKKLLRTYNSGKLVEPQTDIPALRNLLAAQRRINASPLAALLSFSGEKTNIQKIDEALDFAEAYLSFEQQLARSGILPARITELRAQLILEEGGTAKPLLRRLDTALKALALEREAFVAAGGKAFEDEPQVEALLAGLDTHSGRLADWLKWLSSRQRAEAVGLLPLVQALEAGEPISDTAATFERAYMTWWLRLALDASSSLRSFAYWEHEALIQRFRELDQAMTDLAASEVMRRLGNDLPSADSVPRRSELGLLRHQLGLQRPTAAIRNLISEMPTTFAKLAPCVLMSPLSVAQYLPPGQAQFDLVIFDEASQISTWDAVGAIARGSQAIIVGDPKQLPPTNFFGRNDDGEDDSQDIAEFEKDMPSILDEVTAAGIPTHRLNWHYRSRDEALIAFSNHNYYDGRLVTFPSPNASDDALRLHKINGTYMRGQGRTNPDEAHAVVSLIRAKLTEWLQVPESQRHTLGVITFNAQQQSLILDLLDAERKANPSLEWFFADEHEEPVIVKNLENIQGDERDVILFSTTFGVDSNGKLSMNFGALNMDGGEKRLNVAITRARSELHVFSSLTADQIDLSRTSARGVKDFKAFLDFADRGAVALAAQDLGSLGGVDSPFEAAVCEALNQRGWEVHTQIGVSDFRIDLGIRHPDYAGAWLAGVECDGATYHSSATARDRDRIRQAVLEGLGWKVLRIWSTDWFRNSVAAADRVDNALRLVLAQDREDRANAQPTAPDLHRVEALTPSDEPPTLIEVLTEEEPKDEEQTRVVYASASDTVIPTQHSSDVMADPERFFDPAYDEILTQLISQVIAADTPISELSLARRISQMHGWQRTGSRIQKRISSMDHVWESSNEDGTNFLWSKGSLASRVPFKGLAGRTVREVSRTEIAWVEDQHTARIADSEDPVLELSRLIGIARLTQDTRKYLEKCREWRATTI
ncbi:DUF3320 domain-containing protein [Pusillimonas sp. DMV24BSW_D]|uniref:DUF3320 domain-containing protein n=1 Tax=Neopusillimonas aestuarii TaxID=2716226 RepID=UPI001407C935|nr:DUF3320 domain-containing protein [Pusillimonas sp. DMV24BSW_D]QIM50045.1 DUF3320 domain-containing protein [Pusillimonas sp. DMV24BSW_D]